MLAPCEWKRDNVTDKCDPTRQLDWILTNLVKGIVEVMDGHGLRPINNLVCKTFFARETYIPYDDGGPKRAGSVVFR